MLWTYQLINLLAQTGPPRPWDDADPAAPSTPAPRLSFEDLKQGLHSQLTGGNPVDRYYRNLLLAIIAMVILFAVLLHLRHRRKSGEAPNSVLALRRELSRGIPFPWGSRLLLWWVARSARVPAAALLVSGELFQKSVLEWAGNPRFALVRQWGAGRLGHLRGVLFDAPGPTGGQA